MALQQAALCAALLLACPPFVFATADAGLFSADVDVAAPRPPAPNLLHEGAPPQIGGRERTLGEAPLHGEGRSRIAGVDSGRLAAARRDVERGNPARLSLNLFADTEFEAVMERTAPTASGYTLTGRLAGDPLSTVVLAVNGDLVAGTVWGADGFYAIRGGVRGASVRQLDPSDPSRKEVCEGGLSPSPSQDASPAPEAGRRAGRAGAWSADATAPVDDGSVIDVLVAYPRYIREHQGGHRAMRVLIDHDLATANEAYRVSGAALRVALAGVAEVDYEPPLDWLPERRRDEAWEPEIVRAALFELQDPSDGRLDEVHTLRDSVAADLVVLHFGDRPEHPFFPWGFGIAFRMDALSSEYWRDWAFAATTSFPFTHELGHNMGLMHERADNPGNQPFPYSHGHAFEYPPGAHSVTYGTVMYTGLFMNRFSNPRQRFPDAQGVPLGVPGDASSDRADGPADAVRHLNEARGTVANFRASAARCDYALSPEAPLLPAAGGEFRVRVETAPGCAWTAAGGRFATPTAGSEGVGDGVVSYLMPANEHWERDVSVLVAGQFYPAKQAGSRPIKPVCERPSAIQQVLTDILEKPCADVAATDLAEVRFLDIEWIFDENSRTLQPGDFDGLSNLRKLDLRGKVIEGLAPGVFSGLSELRELDLSYNRVAGLTPGIFSGLSRLRELDLSYNLVAGLAPGVFNGLSSLDRLRLEAINFKSGPSFGIKRIGPGVFDHLNKLRDLDLDLNAISTIEPSAFAGLTSLISLELERNKLATIEPGLIEGLPALRQLILYGNNLTKVPTEGLGELPNLLNLVLSGNPLGNLTPGVFDNLPNLRSLDLGSIGLSRLAPGVLDKLLLDYLRLSGNQLTTWEAGHVSYSRLNTLYLADNRIARLPHGVFEGLNLDQWVLSGLRLSGNPGAPFAFRVELVRLPTPAPSSSRSAEIAVEVAQGVPFEMRDIGLSASGGVLSAAETRIGGGRLRGDAVRVTPSGDGPVVVAVERVPDLPTANLPTTEPCGQLLLIFTPCLEGFQTAAGAPLVLFGFLDRTLPPDGAVRFDLLSAFPDFPEGTTFTAELSDPVAEAVVEGGMLRVSWAGGGVATVTVAAISPGGQRETRRFEVRALAPPEAVGGISHQSLVAGESLRVAVSDEFRDPDGGPLAYAAESSDPTVASVSVDGGAVSIAGRELGTATVTLTATDPDGLSATLTFRVTVVRAASSYWGGWRSVLLQSPPSE